MISFKQIREILQAILLTAIAIGVIGAFSFISAVAGLVVTVMIMIFGFYLFTRKPDAPE